MVEKNKIPDGYKMSEVGRIPEEWSICELNREVIALEAGVSVNSVETSVIGDDYAVLKTSSISKGRFYATECKKISNKDIKRAKLNPRKNSLLISRMNTPELVGECAYIDKDYNNLFIPDRLWQTKLRSGSELNCQWLNYLFNTKKYRKLIKELATGTSNSMKNISKEDMLSLAIPFPKKSEQQAIAIALSDIDNLMLSLEKLIDKKKLIQQGVMQQLLTGKKRLDGFEGEWSKFKMSELATFYSGGTPLTSNPKYYSGNIKWITSSDLNQKYIDSVDGKISELGLKNSSAKMINKGTLLLALYGATAGVVAISNISAAINQAVLAINTNKLASNKFLFQWFMMKKEWIIATYTQGGQPNLSGDIIKNIEIIVPELDEQEAIANILLDMDKEIEALQKKLDKYKKIKEGMMEELLTGKRRLV